MSERPNEHDWKSCVRLTLYRGFESLSLRQARLQLNPSSTAVSLSITILKYIFVKGNAGIIFDFERPKTENTRYILQLRNEYI